MKRSSVKLKHSVYKEISLRTCKWIVLLHQKVALKNGFLKKLGIYRQAGFWVFFNCNWNSCERGFCGSCLFGAAVSESEVTGHFSDVLFSQSSVLPPLWQPQPPRTWFHRRECRRPQPWQNPSRLVAKNGRLSSFGVTTFAWRWVGQFRRSGPRVVADAEMTLRRSLVYPSSRRNAKVCV